MFGKLLRGTPGLKRNMVKSTNRNLAKDSQGDQTLPGGSNEENEKPSQISRVIRYRRWRFLAKPT